MAAFPLSASPERLAVIEKIVETCGAPEFDQRHNEILLEGLASDRYLAAEEGAEPYTGRVWYSTGNDARGLLRDALEQVNHEEWESPRLFDLDSGEQITYELRRGSDEQIILMTFGGVPLRPAVPGLPGSLREAMRRR